MKIVDQLNQSLTFNQTPKRIISLVPSQTELLVDLGLETEIVGVTKFCVHPTYLRKDKTIVGGTKKVNFEKIIALLPDIIICNKEENTKEMVTELQKIAPVWISDIVSIEDSLDMISKLGCLFDKENKATSLIEDIVSERDLFLEFIKNKKSQKVAYLIWKNPYMIAGKNTFINELLKLNKLENISLDLNSRYPEVSELELKKAAIILLSTEPFPFKEKDVKQLKSALDKKVILIDGEYFSWYGSRLKDAFNYFKSLPI